MHPRTDIYEIAEQITEEWKNGASFDSMRIKYKCSHSTIHKAILKAMPFEEYIVILRNREAKRSERFTDKMSNKPVPIGTISVRKAHWQKGFRLYREIKYQEGKGLKRKGWKPLSVYKWEMVNGPLPKGHIVTFLDGNSMNDDLSNLKAMPRSEFMKLVTSRPDFYGPRWRKGYDEGLKKITPSMRAARNKKISEARRRWAFARKLKRKEEADAKRIAKLREIIPVPACVKERMQSGWWDNRGEGDDDTEV